MAQHRSWSISPVVLILWTIVVLAAGGATGLWIGLSKAPASVTAPRSAQSIPIVTAPFDDARQVQLKMTAEPALALSAHTAGVITETACETGAEIASGTIPWRINGAPVLALTGDTPYYRDLVVGVSGPDVASLQRELVRLGEDLRISGTFDEQTGDAVGRLLGGANSVDDGLPLEMLTWLPSTSVKVESCNTVLGGPVADGAPLAMVAGAVTDLRIAPMPLGMVPGDRVLTVGGVTARIAGDGRLRDRADVDGILATDAGVVAEMTAASSDPVPLKGTLALAKSIDAATVPATAVVSGNATMCVFDASGAAYGVNIVDSALGRSIVQFERAVPSQVQVAPGGEATCNS